MRKLAIINGKIYVERENFAQAVYCEDGFIKTVGSTEDILAAAGKDAEIIDLEGKTMIPGMIDSHCHIMLVGSGLQRVRTTGAKSVEDIVEKSQKFLAEHPEVSKRGMQSMGWNEDLFTEGEKRVPNRHDLDRISTDFPIVFRRACGHKAAVNTKAIEMMGLDHPGFEPIPGGTVEVEEDGFPSGVITERSINAFEKLFPPYTKDDYKKMFLDAANYAVSVGLTGVQANDVSQSMGHPKEVFAAVQELYEEGLIPFRYTMDAFMASADDFRQALVDGPFAYKTKDDLWFRVNALKLQKDGSLGGRTATRRWDYADDPGNRGVEVITNETFKEFMKIADENDITVVCHCIGDQAIEDCIDAYESVLRDGKNPLRHGIIHCQITDKGLLQRIKDDDLVVYAQPIFLDYDLHAMETRCEDELSATSYAFNTLCEMGVPVGYGTDAPVEDLNPYPGLYCAVTRKDKRGYPEGGWWPAECVDIYRAVDCYTVGNAYLEFHENVKGRIKPGYVADFAVCSKDIFTVAPEELLDCETVMTIIDGSVVYKK